MRTYQVVMRDGAWVDVEASNPDDAAAKAVTSQSECIVGWPLLPDEVRSALSVAEINLVEI